MSKAIWAIESLIVLFGKLSGYLVVLLATLVVYDALNRYLFSGGSVALQELEWHLFDMIFLLGLSFALQADRHVRVDMFYAHFSDRRKAIVDLLSNLLLILPFVLMVIYVSYDYVMLSFNQHEISPDPGGLCCRYLIKSMMIVGFVLLGLQSLAEIYKNIKSIRECA